MKIAHIINPVKVNGISDLNIAQPITFESMRRSVESTVDSVDVELYVTCFPEDLGIVPDYFGKAKNLERSVLEFGGFKMARKLPLLKDILNNIYDASDADYLIYSNVDIATMPYFYNSISSLINQGHDAIIINRRTIPAKFTNTEELQLMYAEAGTTHVGFDCFVFSRKLFKKFNLYNSCIGISLVGLVFALNLYRHANNFKLVENAHLTFHIGDDKSWFNPDFNDYYEHNQREALKTISDLEDQFGLFNDLAPTWTYNCITEIKGIKNISSTNSIKQNKNFIKLLAKLNKYRKNKFSTES